jgi:hypothetical protein
MKVLVDHCTLRFVNVISGNCLEVPSLTDASEQSSVCPTEIMLEAARALEAIMGDEGKNKQQEEATCQGPFERVVDATTLIGKDGVIENLLMQIEVSLVESFLAEFQSPHIPAFELIRMPLPRLSPLLLFARKVLASRLLLLLLPSLGFRVQGLKFCLSQDYCCCCSRVVYALAGEDSFMP